MALSLPLYPPFLSFTKYSFRFSGCTAAATALFRTLSRPPLNSSPLPRPLHSMATTDCKSSPLQNPLHFPSSAIKIPSVAARTTVESGLNGSNHPSLVVVSFYRFADFPDHASMRKPLKDLCEEVRVSGGIILAPEGINGSICGTRESVERVLSFIQSDERLKGLRMVESPVTPEDEAIHHGHTSSSPLGAGDDAPFRWDHVRVKLKKEIVTFGDPSVLPTKMVGKYVKPRDWNELISDPETMVIDVRNMYEIRIGKFKRAVDPCTNAFREFPTWVDEQFDMEKSEESETANTVDRTLTQSEITEQKSLPRVAMYCTGGIRCEKASSFLLSKGFNEVYHLEGGILKYLEEVPKSESLWEGECFVFDKRVSVEHGMVPGTYKLCYGCKQPVSDEDMKAPEWEYGVSCPYCFSIKSEEEKERARARQRQFETWGVIGGPDKGRRKPNPVKINGEEHDLKGRRFPNSI
ncbi:rhodanese-like domain-containing protein 7 [Carex littledalei]|uniref:Rhodanese-like domain-containing protein 7 n=1 Tax=Carex littledalei TaxID=544730 RepID=A0A833R152_9POAL|nr:rhodanese-like domain-containing protein 7 [Carex littledalei]